jgi:hypothetical protein
MVICAALSGLVVVAGCGQPAERRAVETTVEAAGTEEAALAAMGFDVAQVAAEPSAGAGPGREGRAHRRPLRVLLHRNVLHGEAVVQTKDGPRTVVVQRGTVTAVDAAKITVKSSDGFTLTWTLGDPLRVVEHRRTIQPSDVTVGAEVGVAGPTGTARLIVIR